MDGSGLKEILETVYGENAVAHMMSGKAVQRAFSWAPAGGSVPYTSDCC